MHVYFTARQEQVDEIRCRIRKPDGVGAIKCTDGELRVGVGCYSVLPPSRHPRGGFYRWDLPILAEAPPLVDLIEAGFATAIDAEACNRDAQRGTEAMTSVVSGYSVHSVDSGVSDVSVHSEDSDISVLSGVSGVSALSAVSAPLCCIGEEGDRSDEIERGSWSRCRQVQGAQRAGICFGPSMKAIPGVSDAPAKDCKAFVQRWHELAKPVITTKPFEETWIDFLKAWSNVKFPKGSEPLTIALKAALESLAPKVAAQFEQQQLRLLVGLCRELTLTAAPNPFFLSCRTAGNLVGVDYSTASRWLFLLVVEGVLKIAVKGGRDSQRATRYEYLGDW